MTNGTITHPNGITHGEWEPCRDCDMDDTEALLWFATDRDARERDRDRSMEAALGGRLLFHFPLGSVKTTEAARRCDRLTVRLMALRHSTASDLFA